MTTQKNQLVYRVTQARARSLAFLLRSCFLLALCMCLSACSENDQSSPEAQVQAVMQQMEAAIEARKASELFEHVSENYRDHKGNDRDALRRFAQVYLLRNQGVAMATSVRSISLIDANTVAVEAAVVMGAKANNPSGLLPQLSADSQNVSAVFQLESDAWKLSSMSWEYQAAY